MSFESSWFVLLRDESIKNDQCKSSKLKWLSLNNSYLLQRCKMHHISNVKIVDPIFRWFDTKWVSIIKLVCLVISYTINFFFSIKVYFYLLCGPNFVCKILFPLFFWHKAYFFELFYLFSYLWQDFGWLCYNCIWG